MTIEWRQRPSGLLVAECGDLTLIAFEGRGDLHFRAIVEIESQPLLDGFDYDTLDAAKLAAETFAREWVARQARALGDGWIPVAERLPEDFDAVVILAKECDGYVRSLVASPGPSTAAPGVACDEIRQRGLWQHAHRSNALGVGVRCDQPSRVLHRDAEARGDLGGCEEVGHFATASALRRAIPASIIFRVSSNWQKGLDFSHPARRRI